MAAAREGNAAAGGERIARLILLERIAAVGDGPDIRNTALRKLIRCQGIEARGEAKLRYVEAAGESKLRRKGAAERKLRVGHQRGCYYLGQVHHCLMIGVGGAAASADWQRQRAWNQPHVLLLRIAPEQAGVLAEVLVNPDVRLVCVDR